MKKIFAVFLLYLSCLVFAQENLPVLSVLDFETVQVSSGEAKLFTDVISSYFLKLGKYRVIDSGQRENILKEFQFQLSGCTSEECQLEIGKLLAAEYIVIGSLGPFGERYVLTIKLVEVESGETINSVSKIYNGMNDLIDNAHSITAELAGIETESTPDENTPRILTVSSVSALLAAINSDTTIILEPGAYRIDIRQDLKNNARLKWIDNYDGYYPSVRNVSNLTIRGNEEKPTEILIDPMYGWVLEFFNCSNVQLVNLTIGHTEQGYCAGGVLNFIECEDVRISGCDMFGCGTIGIAADTTINLNVENSIIRECTYGLLEFSKSEYITFTNTVFRNTGDYSLISFRDSYYINFRKCEFRDNEGSTMFYSDYLSDSIKVEDSSFTANQVTQLFNEDADIQFFQCSYKGNTFRQKP